jgi:hypothetical protein
MRRFSTTLLAMLLLVVAVPARAFVPQTIALDGVNDFDPSNLLSDDTNDTQPGCVPPVLPLDLGRIYVTNDANYLYVGIEYAQACFMAMNVGMAFDVGTAAGGVTDPWARKIGWANVPYKPDFVLYDRTPDSGDLNGWQAFYKDTLGAWAPRGGGSHALGVIDGATFKELKLPLATLGVTTGTVMHLEFWVTQNDNAKGPIDAMASDDVQTSNPGGTVYNPPAVVQMTQMIPYTILNSVDTVPPTVSGAEATGFTILSNRQVQLFSNKIDVQFSEPVDLTTSQVAGNYVYSGASARTVISAVRDAATPSTVHLTLNAPIASSATAHAITVTGVKDAAVVGNTIVANGTTNVGACFIQNVTINGDFTLGLCSGNFTAADTIAIEGSRSPLTWSLCDNVLMTDANADGIYNATIPFTLPRNPATLKGEADLAWKFSHKCVNYEPLGANRDYHLTSDNGAAVVIDAVWNNEVPANFTTIPVDVVFKVDATLLLQSPGDVITLLGNTIPLSFTQPGVTMLDNGVAPDAVAGDKIYTARVSFPRCTPKHVEWKVDYNGTIECLGQGNRSFTIDDLVYSAVNPLVLPVRGIDRCTVTDKPVTIVFKVNMTSQSPTPGAADTVVVKGDGKLLDWGWPAKPAAIMADDGIGYDDRAHDGWFTKAITLPDSTPMTLGFKYGFKLAGWTADSLECRGIGNRTLTIDDQVYSAANPIVRLLNLYGYCTDPAGVAPGSGTPSTGAAFGALRAVMPNPVAKRANFSFELYRRGHVTFSVYDVTGRRVARLVDGVLPAGVHSVAWDGVSNSGLRLANGVYMYEVAMGGDRLARRMILVH